ncbi:MAG TPA: hypothetical protein VIU62_07145 [Chloroflexota bacterium]
MTLVLQGFVDLPAHAGGGFDHRDVHWASGTLYVAHTANDSIEIVDGRALRHLATVPDCLEASGVLCAQEEGLVFAAAGGGGAVLVLPVGATQPLRELRVGPRPNGLAWDPDRQCLLVADVGDRQARLLDVETGGLIGVTALPGRPRWCVFDQQSDRFLVNILEPPCMVALHAPSGQVEGTWRISSPGPHGLDLDVAGQRAFVACDSGAVIVLDLATGRELASVPIAGEPDAIWYHPNRHLLYVAIGNPGVVDVIDCRALRVVEQVVTEAGAHTTAFDPGRDRLFVFLPRSGRAAIYDEQGG